jgi:hypothetical protein
VSATGIVRRRVRKGKEIVVRGPDDGLIEKGRPNVGFTRIILK